MGNRSAWHSRRAAASVVAALAVVVLLIGLLALERVDPGVQRVDASVPATERGRPESVPPADLPVQRAGATPTPLTTLPIPCSILPPQLRPPLCPSAP